MNKSQLGNLQAIILTLVVVGVLVGAGFFILGEFQDQVLDLAGGNVSALGQYEGAYDGINSSMDALDNVPSLLPLVVLIAMVVVILALVFTIPGARSGA